MFVLHAKIHHNARFLASFPTRPTVMGYTNGYMEIKIADSVNSTWITFKTVMYTCSGDTIIYLWDNYFAFVEGYTSYCWIKYSYYELKISGESYCGRQYISIHGLIILFSVIILSLYGRDTLIYVFPHILITFPSKLFVKCYDKDKWYRLRRKFEIQIESEHVWRIVVEMMFKLQPKVLQYLATMFWYPRFISRK